MDESRREYFVSCSHGLEPLLASELRDLGCNDVKEASHGVRLYTDGPGIRNVCLWSRLASHVLMTVGSFSIRNADDLYQKCLKLPWGDWLSSLNTFAIQGIGTNDSIRHSGFMALKVKDALCDNMRKAIGRRPSVDKTDPDVCFVVHLRENAITISLDLSGTSLHKRGWRRHGGEAPLKENLAAAVLLSSGFTGREPLVDPMCGSGTLAIEAAEMASGLAAGRRMSFGFERWPTFEKEQKKTFEDRRRALCQTSKRRIPPIFAADINPDVIEMARTNIHAAGMDGAIRLQCADARRPRWPIDRGVLITNIPYGERLKSDDLMDLYKDIGIAFREAGHFKMGIFCAHVGFTRAFDMKPDFVIPLHNGPIKTKLFLYHTSDEVDPHQRRKRIIRTRPKRR